MTTMEPIRTRLEGRVVVLEPLRPDHADALAAVGLDPALWALTTTAVRTPAEMRAYVGEALEAERAGTALPFAIVERTSRTVVGSTRYCAIERSHRRLEIGWTWIARPWQRTAVNTETKYLLLRHAFETLAALRVEFKTDATNLASRAALLRIGAFEEGTLRHHMVTWTGRMRDSVYYSILAPEWPERRRALEERLGGISH